MEERVGWESTREVCTCGECTSCGFVSDKSACIFSFLNLMKYSLFFCAFSTAMILSSYFPDLMDATKSRKIS